MWCRIWEKQKTANDVDRLPHMNAKAFSAIPHFYWTRSEAKLYPFTTRDLLLLSTKRREPMPFQSTRCATSEHKAKRTNAVSEHTMCYHWDQSEANQCRIRAHDVLPGSPKWREPMPFQSTRCATTEPKVKRTNAVSEHTMRCQCTQSEVNQCRFRAHDVLPLSPKWSEPMPFQSTRWWIRLFTLGERGCRFARRVIENFSLTWVRFSSDWPHCTLFTESENALYNFTYCEGNRNLWGSVAFSRAFYNVLLPSRDNDVITEPR
jgi:hypothetical protein